MCGQHRSSRLRGAATALALVTATLTLTACSSGKDQADPLASYTDPGDGCAQVMTAISYADDVLRSQGQEAYQEFTDEVRSRVSAVQGTANLEQDDFPTKQILRQAQLTGTFAQDAMKAGVARVDRVRELREYRREAAELVLMCGPYVDPTQSPRNSAAGTH